MTQIPAYISIFIMFLVVLSLLINYRKLGNFSKYFIGICVCIFGYELMMWLVKLAGFDNHWIANVNSLLYFPIALSLLFQVYKSVLEADFPLRKLQYIFVPAVFISWILENLILGNVRVFHPYVPASFSFIMMLISIYLINVIIFKKSDNLLKDRETLIVMALLIRSSAFSLTLWFLNFGLNFGNEFYRNLIFGINCALCVADILLLMAVPKMFSIRGKTSLQDTV